MAISIVTGYTGTPHVTADSDGAINTGIFGNGDFVLNNGNKFNATIINSNTVRVADGDLILQGRLARQLQGVTQDMAIENGTAGWKRQDLIVARYVKSGGVESVTFAVYKGTAQLDAPQFILNDPAITTGTLRTGSLVHEMKLWRVSITGTTITAVTALFTVASDTQHMLIYNTAYWTLYQDLVLNKGQWGYHTGREMFKLGDGVTTFQNLPFVAGMNSDVDTTNTNIHYEKHPSGGVTIFGGVGIAMNASGGLDYSMSFSQLIPEGGASDAVFALGYVQTGDNHATINIIQTGSSAYQFLIPNGTLTPNGFYDCRFLIKAI